MTMRMRTLAAFLLTFGLSAQAFGQGAPAATSEIKKPTWSHGHDLKVRLGGTKDFDKQTPKIGVELFKDNSAETLVAVTDSGAIAVTPLPKMTADTKTDWTFAHDLRSRKSDEEKFSDSTTKYGIEVFKDRSSGKLIYASQKGSVALGDAPEKIVSEKEPQWHHALILKARNSKETEFNDKTAKFGVEIFKDGGTGGLIYVCETGSIAVGPAPANESATGNVLPPKLLYGFTVKVRKADEADFSGTTTKYGVEVFRDENTGAMIYISETGSIAVALAPSDMKSGQGVTWKHAMQLKARPSGVSEFDKANKYGVEVFLDNNTGHLVYITSAGNIAVLQK